jgi:spore coat polysaccharide biosynthesis protein SpsF (cytidylyltransferase family)
MASTRLPSKVLARLAGRSVLEHCVERLRARSGLRVILATTTQAEDDCLEHVGTRLGLEVVRGAADDVLGRFVQAVRQHGLTEVVRATADNPCVDLDGPRRALELLRRSGADYVVEHGSAYGAAVEAMTAETLERANALVRDAGDREHVTPFIRRDSRFRALVALPPSNVRCPALRITVDTLEDLTFVRNLVTRAEQLHAAPVPLPDLIAVAAGLGRSMHLPGAVERGSG